VSGLEAITNVTKNMQRINAAWALDILINRSEFQDLIIELNTEGLKESQLFEHGIDSQGKSLGEYAATTIEGTASFEGKREKGQRFDHITLKDTGGFYATWRVSVKNGVIMIDADPTVDDGNLFDDFGEDIVGLIESNVQILIDAVENVLPELVLEAMLAD